MAKLQFDQILNEDRGQSVVEYILLLAVIISLSFIIYRNQAFQKFIKGEEGFFASMKKGMIYSYRYGRDINTAADYNTSMNFEYQSNAHDTYMNKADGQTHFFMGVDPYPK